GVRIIAISHRTLSSPTIRSTQRPSTGISPSSSIPSSTKKAFAASRSSTTMRTLSIRLSVMSFLSTLASRYQCSSVHRLASQVTGRDVDLLWHGKTVSVDIRAGRLLPVGDQRRAGFFGSRGDDFACRHSGQVSEQELLGGWETERHSDAVDGDFAKACRFEQATELGAVPQGECGGAGA